ncbi:hypothetical protein Avbf_13778 [Armadillidium vulgare]|nr:hypothetical protein Avbf_13778 [Armadillidium vulgare]
MWFIGDKVLSIDTSIFVPDKRLFLSYDSETGTWILEINKVQMRDQGNYSCQVEFSKQTKFGKEELQQNLSSIWVEINELKANLETHIKDSVSSYRIYLLYELFL